MKRNTQFVIWANYDMKSDNNMYISANRMSSLVLETAGLAQNGYQQFVSEFSKKVPIITKKKAILVRMETSTKQETKHHHTMNGYIITTSYSTTTFLIQKTEYRIYTK